MSTLNTMLEYRRLADHAKVRIIAWKCTKAQVKEIVKYVGDDFDDPPKLHYVSQLFDARVILVDA
jgi:hypothetical protein